VTASAVGGACFCLYFSGAGPMASRFGMPAAMITPWAAPLTLG
jgi:hypothetical protein